MSETRQNYRELEQSIHTDLTDRLSYGKYLHLSEVLNAQHRLTDQHDEMLFIIIHQASELWLKLAGHEVEAAIRFLKHDNFRHAFKVIARVKLILTQLTHSWSILATMTPVDYLKFRDSLGPASGFQSYCYRKLEFLLGNKNEKLVKVHRHDPAAFEELTRLLHEPSLYDVVLRKLNERGFPIDAEKLERDFSQPYQPNESVRAAWFDIYSDPDKHFELYEMAEKLVDIEDAFQLWRFKHMYTVQRIIGTRRGTGGSSGVPFLKKAIDTSFFPELFAIRTNL
ncbi:MAG: tryptophan 2,3-dioxygenase family protein [Xanthomonadales bacterium]|nr:tryptophan 2,3-dioxygenase family protein [Xanthomonadales bacterium]